MGWKSYIQSTQWVRSAFSWDFQLGFPVSLNLPLSVATVNTVKSVFAGGEELEGGRDRRDGGHVWASFCNGWEVSFTQLCDPHCTQPDYSFIYCLNLRFPSSYQAPKYVSRNTHTLLFKLSFPHSCALVFPLHPISLLVGLPLLLYPSICPSHTGFTSLLSTMTCFFFF